MSATIASLTREQYVARRVAARYRQRGDAITLRRVTLAIQGAPSNPVPYKNPPDVSVDLRVVTAIAVTGQVYLGLAGTTAIGRLVPGDQIICYSGGHGAINVIATWVVDTMSTAIATDSDGIPRAESDGTPILGVTTPYSPDSLATANRWTVVPVTLVSGDPVLLSSTNKQVKFAFAADQAVYGVLLSLQEMTALGWVELDALGFNIAAYNAGAIDPPPKVDDLLIFNGQVRSITAASQTIRRGTELLFPVQAR